MNRLGGMHDREGRHVVPTGGWCLDLIALAENPPPTDYIHLKDDINWIARTNWGYGTIGTLPLPNQYEEMARRLARYVAASNGCHIWIVGNEPNLPREWPERSPDVREPILPLHYAECYLTCRDAVHAVPGHEQDEVIVAGPGPWNADLTYAGNEKGDWVKYCQDVQEILGMECDGFSFHGYTHGYDPALVTSDAKMDPPFDDHHYEFRVYQDFANAVRPELRHLPMYLTEANGNGPWRATGLIPAMLEEISAYNASVPNGFQCLIFYRYPGYDENAEFAMGDKPDVIAEFVAAMQRDYVVPDVGESASVPRHQQFIPSVSTGTTTNNPPVPATPRDISAEFRQRVPEINLITPQPGEQYFELEVAEYVPDGARRFGPDHHILVDVIGLDGKRKLGETVNFYYADGDIPLAANKVSEPYAVDYGMTQVGHAWGVWVGNDRDASDSVFGMGLGLIGSEWIADHVDYFLRFREKIAPEVAQPQPAPPKHDPPLEAPIQTPVVQPPMSQHLIWPTDAPRSQRWGENPAYYRRELGIPYHNGIDHAAAMGTPVRAMADGEVLFVGTDSGYGHYVRIYHATLGLHTFIAHLQEVAVYVGDMVKQGEIVAYCGASGMTATRINADGTADTSRPAPHTHTEIRLGSRNAYAEGVFGHSNGRVDPETVMYLVNHIVGEGASSAQPVDPLAWEALLAVESSGEGFVNGRLKIRIEGHLLTGATWGNPAVFSQLFRRDESNPLLEYYRPSSASAWIMYHANQDLEWQAFDFALRLDGASALRCTSMGLGQTMGFNAQRVGYANPAAMLQAFERGEQAQQAAIINYCVSDADLVAAMRRRDWDEVARRYNGDGQEAIYAPRLAAAYQALG